MKQFNVLVLGKYLNEDETRIVYESFAQLYQTVTPKHRRKMKLMVWDDPENLEQNQKRQKYFKLGASIEILNANTKSLDDILPLASILYMPTLSLPLKTLSKALSFGVPYLGYDHLEQYDILDQTCSMVIRYRNVNHSISEFTHLLNIIYFDPEVRKILQRGAEDQYFNSLSWGRVSR